MRNHLLLSSIGLTLAFTAAPLEATTFRIVEQAVETSTMSISVPDKNAGSLAVKACPSCKPMLLRLTPETRYLIGKTEVPYAEFVDLARGSSDRGLGIFYDGKERTITRLIISGTRVTPPRRR